jgi:RNA polymerase sigma-70 factor, ECF subfamily
MLNDGFMKIFTKLNLYDNSLSFEAWFRTLMVRTCIDYHRKHSSKVVLDDIEDHYEIGEAETALDKLNAEVILELVQKLPAAYRLAFSLYVIEGYSHAEIAEMLNINEGTSRSNLAKARLKLQKWVLQINNDNINQKDHEFF